jgi:hypothetical protein
MKGDHPPDPVTRDGKPDTRVPPFQRPVEIHAETAFGPRSPVCGVQDLAKFGHQCPAEFFLLFNELGGNPAVAGALVSKLAHRLFYR